MDSKGGEVDKGCRQILIWLAIIAAAFLVCVAIGITIFALNISEHAGKAVRADLFFLIDQAEVSEDERIAARVRVDNLIRAYQEERMTQDDFIAESVALREDLLTKQRPGFIDPATGKEVAPASPALQ